MPFNIAEFQAHNELIGNARYYNYAITVSPPAGLTWNNPNDEFRAARTVRFVCDSVNFPSTGAQVYNVRRYGYGALERKPVFPVFNQIQMTLQLDEATGMQKFFHDWMRRVTNYDFDTIISTTTNTNFNVPMATYELGYKIDYAVPLILHIFSSTGKEVRRVIFREAYPISIENINYAWGHENDYVKLPIMWTFFDWADSQAGGETVVDPLK